MSPKGYDFPLYSLDLVAQGSPLPDRPQFSIAVQQGRLVVRPPLRARGARLTTVALDQGVRAALQYVDLAPLRFSQFGYGPDWMGSMEHWRQQMLAEERAFAVVGGEDRLGTGRRAGLQGRAVELWRHLQHCAALAGVGGVVPPGRPPRSLLALMDGLRQAGQRAQGRLAELERRGYLQSDQQELLQVTAALSQEHQGAQQRGWDRQGHSGRLAVMRGALWGDLGQLVASGARVLSPRQREGLQLGVLVGEQRRQTKAGAAEAAQQGQQA